MEHKFTPVDKLRMKLQSKEEEAQIVIALREQSLSYREIEEKTGLGQSHISSILRNYRPDLSKMRSVYKRTHAGNGYHKSKIGGRTKWPEIVAMRRQNKTYDEIAQVFGGVSRERIRQIIVQMEPSLTGWQTGVVAKCCGCGRENPKGDYTAIFPQQARDQNVILCRECWPHYMVYRRTMQTAMCYAARYQFVKDGLASGIQAYKLGWLWNKEEVPQIHFGDKCTSKQIWSHRIREKYEQAIKRLRIKEHQQPWLRGYYEAQLDQSEDRAIAQDGGDRRVGSEPSDTGA